MALIDNLIAYWELEESSGTRVDSHGANDLTDNNTVLSAAGKIGTAADLERANSEYLSLADNTDLSTGDIDFTFAAWIKLETAGGVILSKWHDTGPNYEYWLADSDGTGKPMFFVRNAANSASVSVTSGTTLSTGVWYYVIAWHDSVANTLNLQVNDGTVASVSHSGGVRDGTAAFLLGSQTGGTINFFDGCIDDVGFWKRVLTSGERTRLYNGGSGLSYAGILTSGEVAVPVRSRRRRHRANTLLRM